MGVDGGEDIGERGGQPPHTPPGAAGPPTYAALDLGTNNCRLLIARPTATAFRVIDSFSRIVRLGEGVGQSGCLGSGAIARTLEALRICREKLDARQVTRMRLIATEACRAASNGEAFIARVAAETGLALEIVDRQTEASLATTGCAALVDERAEGVLLFDIGGGSSEVVWLKRCPGATAAAGEGAGLERMRHWTSLRLGVVTLAERFGGRDVDAAVYQAMVDEVAAALADFAAKVSAEARCRRFHLLGTSGTVTTLAGVHLALPRYDRRRVDGLWMSSVEIDAAMARMRRMSYAERAAHGCIGPDRADLVLAGCAIFEAIRRAFPSTYVRIADRGLREGLLMQMMAADGAWRRGEPERVA